ncbi:hypothetical protein [Streptomyces sp. NPDC059575]|uniref:hypothetical protein n=1 Tax=Streptomyces sp. NPDC059575 TaxID=3346872 RepID=UPI003680C676
MSSEDGEAGQVREALLRAVDSGSLPQVEDVLPEPVHVGGPLREELLTRARRLARTGAEGVLRERTGLTGPAQRTREADGTGSFHERLTVGELALYDGQLAVLTALERHFRRPASFGELRDRALAHPDREHVVWAEVMLELEHRPADETWDAAVRLSTDPDPVARLFAADVLLSQVVEEIVRGDVLYSERAALLLPWARREPDAAVLEVLLNGLTWAGGPEPEKVGLAYAGHPEPGVRAWMPMLLDTDGHSLSPEGLAAVLTLAGDPDPEVRGRVCAWLEGYQGREPAIADALVVLSRDERQRTRIDAVAALAYRDDPRCVAAERHIGPLEPGLDAETLPLFAVMDHQRRMRERGDYPGGSIHPPAQE